MFAVVANGLQTICKTQRQLDNILALYTYPKFAKVSTEEEALRWIREHTRGVTVNYHKQYGETADFGFLNVTYEVHDSENSIHYHIDSEQLGYITAFNDDKDVAVRSGRTSTDVIVSNIVLDDMKISSHIIAVRRILMIIGSYVDVNIILPDMSVFLAITKYKGKNYNIRGLQKEIASRLGGVSFSVKGEFL